MISLLLRILKTNYTAVVSTDMWMTLSACTLTVSYLTVLAVVMVQLNLQSLVPECVLS